jgi:hypothetical protein
MSTLIKTNEGEITLITDKDLDDVAGGVSMSFSSIEWVYTKQRPVEAPPPPPTH